MSSPSEIRQVLNQLRYDCTAMQGRITSLLAMVSLLERAVPAGAKVKCPDCCLLFFPSERRLLEHRSAVHFDELATASLRGLDAA